MSSLSHFRRLARTTLYSTALVAPLIASQMAHGQTIKSARTRQTLRATATVQIAQPVEIATIADSVPPAVATATLLGPVNPDTPLSVLIAFQFADPQAAANYASTVSDPNSLLYRQWLTPEEVGQKFGPDLADYTTMLQAMQFYGLQADPMPANHMTLRVTGTAGQMAQAFGVTLNNYQEAGEAAVKARGAGAVAYTFFAPSTPIQIPGSLDGKITSVEGLQNYTRPIPLSRKAKRSQSTNFDAAQTRVAYDLSGIYGTYYGTASPPGTGRTIAITNFDGTDPTTNAPLYVTRNLLPVPSGGSGSNITRTTVGGSSSGTSGQGEGDLDYQMALGQAPLASIIIYDNGSQNLLGVLAQEASENKADILSESYGWGLSASSATSTHNQHLIMTTQGQTYFTASGDTGNIASSSYQYSDYEPEVTTIGGTTLTVNSGTNTYSSETGWGVASGPFGAVGSGGGIGSVAVPFNSHTGTGGASWQVGRNVGTSNSRYAPDIAFHAAGSSNGGAYYFYYGGGLTGGSVGTSFASPMSAGQLALLEQDMIAKGLLTANSSGKYRLGNINSKIYSFNGRNDIFHDITTGGASPALGTTTYWDQTTGWGSVDWANLEAAFFTPLAVAVTPTTPTIAPAQTQQLTATVAGSNIKTVTWSLVSGPGSVSSSGLYTAPTSVTAPQTAVVRATSTLDTASAGTTSATVQPNPVYGQATITVQQTTFSVSGNVTLGGISNPAATVIPVNPVTITFTPTSGSPTVTNQTLGSGGSFSVAGLLPGTYTLRIKGDKWLSASTSVTVPSGNVTGIALSLLAGDADNSNTVDSFDFNILAVAYGSSSTVSNSGYNAAADFNNDGLVNVTDFNLLVGNYGLSGN